jgi:uncharacterized protein YjdB
MKLIQKSLAGIILGLLLVFAGCEQPEAPDVSGDQVQTFTMAYSEVLAKNPGDSDLEDFTDEVNAALQTWEQLSPGAQETLATEKAKLDELAAKLADLREARTVFYIAPDGNDGTGDGSIETPWFSLNKAEEAVSAGCTVYIRGGTYQIPDTVTETRGTGSTKINYVFHMTKSGRPNALIKYLAYPGDAERPVFDMSEVKPLDVRVYVLVVEGSYLHFKGFDIIKTQVNVSNASVQTQAECVLNLGGNNNIYEELVMRDGMAIGFYLTAGSNNLILNCDAYNNWDSRSDNGAGGDTDGFGAHLSSTSHTGNIFRGCRAWLNSDDGFDSISCSAAITVENCWAFYNGYKVVNGQYQNASGSGVGFKIGGFGNNDAVNPVSPTPRHIIQFSLAAHNRGQGFYANHHWGGNNWYNNTAYKNRQNFNMWGRKDGEGRDGYDHILINNLSYSPRESGNDITNLPLNENKSLNNSFDLGLKLSDADFVSVFDWTELAASRKADGSLPDVSFLKPAATSKIIDRGRDIGFQYRGAAPDLGCTERQGGAAAVLVSGISLNKNTLSLTGFGKQEILTAVIAPDNAVNKAVRWSSTDTNVASVIWSGLSATVTSIDTGTATVTVTTEDGGFSASCTITVSPVVVTGVSLDAKTLSIPKGDSATLTATISPPDATNHDLIWQSEPDNTAVEITGSGSQVTINGINSGTAIITVTTEDGGYQDTCTVTVTASIAVSGVSLDKTTLSILPGATATLTAAISPGNASNQTVTWSSNGSAVTVTGNGLTATLTAGSSTGSAAITVTTEDGAYTDTCAVTVEGPKLIVRNMSASPGSSTTANTDSFISLGGGNNSYSWTGNTTLVNAETGSFGNNLSKVTLAYIPSPAAGKFTWTAKIALSGGSGGSDGLMFGVFTDLSETLPETTSSANPLVFIYFAGARHVFSGTVRGYYTRSTAVVATTSLNDTNSSTGGVYIYKVVWDGSKYSITITKPDDTGSVSTEVTTSTSTVAAQLFNPAQGRYPGFGIVDGTATITEASLTFDN